MGLKDNRNIYDSLNPALRDKAIKFLRKLLTIKTKKEIKIAINNNPEHWFTPYHFGWGMTIRNKLREAGFGENDFEIKNIDDIYVELVEDAINK